MLTPEELQNLQERRYVVGRCNAPQEGRTLVFVFDKLSKRVIYKVNIRTEDRKKPYQYIQRYYGEDNCVPPQEIDIKMYEQ